MSSVGIGYVIYNCMVTLNGIFDYNKEYQYSKDKEFEADKIGIRMYNTAGYSVDEIFTTCLLYTSDAADE